MLYTENRETEVRFLKRLWQGEETLCPKCRGANLVHLHKKAKKSNNEWQCPKCGEIYRTIRMLMQLPEK